MCTSHLTLPSKQCLFVVVIGCAGKAALTLTKERAETGFLAQTPPPGSSGWDFCWMLVVQGQDMQYALVTDGRRASSTAVVRCSVEKPALTLTKERAETGFLAGLLLPFSGASRLGMCAVRLGSRLKPCTVCLSLDTAKNCGCSPREKAMLYIRAGSAPRRNSCKRQVGRLAANGIQSVCGFKLDNISMEQSSYAILSLHPAITLMKARHSMPINSWLLQSTTAVANIHCA